MGDHEPRDRSKQPARATAGPSADDRYGPGPIGANMQARIIGATVDSRGTRITIARGKTHGIHVGMEGYVKAAGGMLSELQVDAVENTRCHAYVEVTLDQLTNHHYVMLNPTTMPKTPVVKDTRARVIGASVEAGRTQIIIARGSSHGVKPGMRGQLVAADGREGASFTIAGTKAIQSMAYVADTVDRVQQHPNAILNPSASGAAAAPIQRRATGVAATGDVQSIAQAGVAGASERLPHAGTIQHAFGKHDISGVQAQVGGPAAAATEALGAQAYATGNQVAFASSPDLHTAAHEAAHAIQQRRGAVGFQGLGAADNEHERHADAVADAVVAGRSAEPLLDQLATGSSASAAVQRKPAEDAKQWKLAAPDKVDLGDNVVGTRTKHQASIFAIDRQQGPRIRAKLSGDPSIKLIATPLYLPGTREPYDDTKALQFEHRPERKGDASSTLELEIMDAPYETHRYPVVAAAHLPGEPTLAEQRAAEDQRRRDQQQADRDAAERKRVEKQIAEEDQRDTHYHAGDMRRLERTRVKLQAAINGLYEKRRGGLNTAATEIGEFVREQRIIKPSLLEQLAWMALDMATAGIAGALAKRLDAALSTAWKLPVPKYLNEDKRPPRIERTTVAPSKAIIALFTDGLKDGVKKSTKLRSGSPARGNDVPVGSGDVGSTSDGNTYAKESTNPKAAFFAVQYDSLATENEVRAGELSLLARDALLPTLKRQPEQAIAALKAVLTAVMDEQQDAGAKQAEESVRKWVRYVAATSSDRTPLTPFSRYPVPAIDGVIDISIRPSYRHPELPVEVAAARLYGVKEAVVNRLAKQPLLSLDVPVRVSGGFDGSPSATLTAVRLPGGKVEYHENTRADSDHSGRARWLENKARAHGRGADAEAGARIMLEREIMVHPLNALVRKVDNDSKE